MKKKIFLVLSAALLAQACSSLRMKDAYVELDVEIVDRSKPHVSAKSGIRFVSQPSVVRKMTGAHKSKSNTENRASRQPNRVAYPAEGSGTTGNSGGVGRLLSLIGQTEGTDKGRGYDETLSYGAYTDGPVNLQSMTLEEVDTLQTAMLKHPANHWNSSAVGRYQIVRTTLRGLRKRLGLPKDQRFTAALQDRLAIELLNQRGLGLWKRNEISTAQFVDNLAKEWASLPTRSGRGNYKGQRTGTSLVELHRVLRSIKPS